MTLKAESQNFLDPVLADLSLSIILGFKNKDLGEKHNRTLITQNPV